MVQFECDRTRLDCAACTREMALETVGGNFWKESSRQKPTAFRAQSRKTTRKTIDLFSGHGGSFLSRSCLARASSDFQRAIGRIFEKECSADVKTCAKHTAASCNNMPIFPALADFTTPPASSSVSLVIAPSSFHYNSIIKSRRRQRSHILCTDTT
eukprot:scaffold37478_cov144-Skeletonema_dohrnii-CCMP3373.AAC.3